jgi:hypothetical protein
MVMRGTPEVRVNSTRVGKYVETRASGRATGEMIKQMIADYERLGAGTVWTIAAEGVDSYTSEAMQEAIRGFARLSKERGLKRLVAVLAAPSVRMGASVVSMSLRAAGSPLELCIVKNSTEAAAAVESPLPR